MVCEKYNKVIIELKNLFYPECDNKNCLINRWFFNNGKIYIYPILKRCCNDDIIKCKYCKEFVEYNFLKYCHKHAINGTDDFNYYHKRCKKI